MGIFDTGVFDRGIFDTPVRTEEVSASFTVSTGEEFGGGLTLQASAEFSLTTDTGDSGILAYGRSSTHAASLRFSASAFKAPLVDPTPARSAMAGPELRADSAPEDNRTWRVPPEQRE